MRVQIIGAGLAGLSLARHLKAQDASHEIIISENNLPNQTPGWGIVLSEFSLAWLRRIDAATHARIIDDLVSWDGIEVRKGTTVQRIVGNGYTAVSRGRLIEALRMQCEELGVDFRWGHKVTALPDRSEFDLIVAADGINSNFRQVAFDELEIHRPYYIWLGTTRRFDRLTFLFRDTRYGLFQAYAYPFDKDLSTFIVQCDENVWARSGLSTLELSKQICVCEEAFRYDLAGHPLLHAQARWSQFVTARTSRLHDGNLVLLGDAAHAIHFSIGLGARVAMEGAATLARSLRQSESVANGLLKYEKAMLSFVTPIQVIAQRSARYFESVERYLGQHIVQFSFGLLTRSAQISYRLLKSHDPCFMRVFDRWFRHTCSEPGLPDRHRDVSFQPAETVFRLRSLRLQNRRVLAPCDWPNATNAPARAWSERIVELAGLAPGLILGGTWKISTEEPLTWLKPRSPVLENLRLWRDTSDQVHALGVTLGVFLHHKEAAHGAHHRSRERLRVAFANAAQRADEAKLDLVVLSFGGVSVHALSHPNGNQDTSEYLRHVVFAALESVRAMWPKEKPVSVRLAAYPGSLAKSALNTVDTFAVEIRLRGGDLIQVVPGGAVPGVPEVAEREMLVSLSSVARNGAGVASLVGGNATDLDEINTIIAAGRADLCQVSGTGRVIGCPDK